MSVMLEKFIAADKKSTPLVGINTSDQAAVIESIIGLSEMKKRPQLRWDVVRGLVGLNDLGQRAATKVMGDVDPVSASRSPLDMLGLAEKLPQESVVFMHNAMMFLDPEDKDSKFVIQGIANLRDLYKSQGMCLVMLAPLFYLPPEIAQDVMLLDDPLPTSKELQQIVNDEYEQHEAKAPDDKTMSRTIEALRGLPAFSARQVVALNLTKKVGKLNLSGVWERKIKIIEQTPGLSIWTGKSTFQDIGGCTNVKNFLTRLFNGNRPPWAIAFWDEIEKLFGGVGGDLSGVSQEMLGMILSWMQDTGAIGMIFIGHPGAAKTAIAQAAGNEFQKPLIVSSITAMKSSYVGASTRNLGVALKVTDAVSDGNTMVIATCNKIAALPPELRRRFTLGTYFFDLPTRAEREMIWPIYIAKPDKDATGPLTKEQTTPEDGIPLDDINWTGAEIRQCCNIAWRLNCTLKEAAQYIVPVATANPAGVKILREEAHKRFISASQPGFYLNPEAEETKSTGGRMVRE